MEADDPLQRSLVLDNLGLVGHTLKRYIPRHHRHWDDCFAAGVLGLVEAVDRYDFKHYSPKKFTNYAGYWIKKEIIDELYGSNPRCRGKIKLVSVEEFDSGSKNYESCTRIERGRMWSALIRNILKRLNLSKPQLAALLDINTQRVVRWSNPNSISAPPQSTQIKIIKIVNDFHGRN